MDDGSDTGRTNAEIRQWYKGQVPRISKSNEQWIRQGLIAKERARMAWDLRRTARLDARSMMTDPAVVQKLRERNLRKYGNPNGPTFEFLVERQREKGLEGDAIYEAIIEGASRMSGGIDDLFGL